jgi:hypothetical protein
LKLTGKIAEAAATCAIERSFEASDFLSHIVCDRHFEASERPAALTSATIALFSGEEDLLAHAVQNLKKNHSKSTKNRIKLVKIGPKLY